MSCIASAVSRWIASGETCRKVRPFASNVDTPSVVTSRYGVSSVPVGRRSLYRNSGWLWGSLTSVENIRPTTLTGMEGPLEPDPARMRISDADRHRVAEILREAAGEGRLQLHELDEPLEATYAARTYADLVPITHDLPVQGSPPQPARRPSPVVPGPAGERHVAILGGFDRKGAWIVPQH